jgi:hypothetical protein
VWDGLRRLGGGGLRLRGEADQFRSAWLYLGESGKVRTNDSSAALTLRFRSPRLAFFLVETASFTNLF